MPIHHYQLDPPRDWQEFERLCQRLWMELLSDFHTLMHGRQGQKQVGIDIYGTDSKNGKLVGIQCKGKDANYGKQVTESELRAEVKKALTFTPYPPEIFILATTAPRDRNIQKVARHITAELSSESGMKVLIYAWEDICTRVAMYQNVVNEFFPQYSSEITKLHFGIDEIRNDIANLHQSIDPHKEAKQKFKDRDLIRRFFIESSSGLLSWPRTLRTTDTWIERNEAEDILSTFDSELYSTTILLGEPGTGKSALLGKIAQKLSDDGELVLAIKADQLDHSVQDFASLGLALGLPVAADQALEIASSLGTVYLFIDQMDTLSELVDIQSSRLSVLLNLVRKMSLRPNVHIVASSRPFEFNYDARLSSMKAHQLQLASFEWSTVADILSQYNIVFQEIDDAFKRFLCRPSNLNFYLEYIKRNPTSAFQSYIELYEGIWTSSVGTRRDRARRQDFLLEVASEMTTGAKQALPVARYDSHIDDINWLVGAGILVKESTNKRFAFAHQTLQAFVWTRSFIKQNNSLTDFVLAHQNNLNVRPKLMTALFYLREADRDEYLLQVTSLLSTNVSTIRRHVIYLTLDCIGAHHDPTRVEINLVRRLLTNTHYTTRICRAVSGKASWFFALKDSGLTILMKGEPVHRFGAEMILRNMLPQETEPVVKLISEYWKNSEGLAHISHVLRNTQEWNEQLLELAKYVIVQDSSNDNVAGSFFQAMEKRFPKIGVEFAAFHLSKKLTDLIQSPPDLPEISPGASDVERYVHDYHHNPRVAFGRLFELQHGWHDLPKAAEKVAIDFISNFWPLFVQVCERTRLQRPWELCRYSDCSGTWFRLSDDDKGLRDKYFSKSLESALVSIATNSQSEFLELYRNAKDLDLLPVQRLLAKGLCSLAQANPDFVLVELMADERRLSLGSSIGDHYSGTIELISVLSPKLDQVRMRQLEDYLLAYSPKYETDDVPVESRLFKNKLKRKVRYKLLSAIPESYRHPDVQRLIEEEQRAFGDTITKGFNSGYSGLISEVSPMSLDQMVKAKEDDILKCFDAFPDGTEYRPLGTRVYKGAMPLGRVFEEFAEKYPSRAICILKKLGTPNSQSAGRGVTGVSRSDISLSELLQLIENLETRFDSLSFREDAAKAIERKHSEEVPITIEWLNKIEGWLSVDSMTDSSIETDRDVETNEEPQITSVLWGHNNLYGVPSGNYQIFQCLTWGHLYRTTPLCAEWEKVTLDYIDKGDSMDVWLTFLAIDFPRVMRVCQGHHVATIIEAILDAYPRIIERKELAFTLAESVKIVDDKALYKWLDCLVEARAVHSSQLYGELIGIKWILNDRCDEINSRVDAILSGTSDAELLGLTVTLTEIWEYRQVQITPLLERIIALRNRKLAPTLLSVLRNNELEASGELATLMDALLANNIIAESEEDDTFIAHRLLPLAHLEPGRVAQVCEQLIAAHGRRLGDISTAAASGTSDIITIAITLHNLGPQFQNVGLDIFEKLMEMDAYQVHEALGTIDAVPRVNVVA